MGKKFGIFIFKMYFLLIQVSLRVGVIKCH